jgi:hypothetical protein
MLPAPTARRVPTETGFKLRVGSELTTIKRLRVCKLSRWRLLPMETAAQVPKERLISSAGRFGKSTLRFAGLPMKRPPYKAK